MSDQLLMQIGQLIDVIILIFSILLLANLNSAREYVKKGKINDFIKVAWHFLRLPAWRFFSQYAQVGPDGTYQISYDEHKQIQQKVRRYLGVTIGFTLIKVLFIILGAMIFSSYLLTK